MSHSLPIAFVLYLLSFIGYAIAGQESESRVWTSADGKSKVDAYLLSADGKTVKLKRVDSGMEVTVDLVSLSQQDREYLEKKTTGKSTAGNKQLQPEKDGFVTFEPFGPVPLLPSSNGWTLTGGTPPMIRTKVTIEGPQAEEIEIGLEVHAPMTKSQAVELVKAKYRSMEVAMKERFPRARFDFDFGSSISEKSFTDGLLLAPAGSLGGGMRIYSSIHCQLIGDKAIVVQGLGWSHSIAPSVLEMHRQVLTGIKGRKEWYPASKGIPAEVEQGVSKLIQHVLSLIDQGKYREVIEQVVRPEQLKALLGDTKKLDDLVENFEKHNSQELREALLKADLSLATYDEAAKQLTIPTSQRPLRFTNVDGRWYMEN